MYQKIVYLIFALWVSSHAYIIQLNWMVKTSEEFAIIQMINNFKSLSFSWFWTGWIGFLYALPIAWIDNFVNNHLLSAQIFNILLLVLSWFFLFRLWWKYLHPTYNALLLILFFLSSSILHYNSLISVENLYLALFLLLVLSIHKLAAETSIKSMDVVVNWIKIRVTNNIDIVKKSILVWLSLAILYFAVNEAFISLLAIFISLLYLSIIKRIEFKTFLISFSTILITFLLVISPFIYHLYNITWKILITNKLWTNIAQSEILNNWWNIEKAKYLLTEDKHNFVSWFSEWLKYSPPNREISISNYLFDDFWNNITTIINKQRIIIFNQLPKIVLWDVLITYNKTSFPFYQNKFILIIIYLPVLFFLFWLYKLLITKLIKITHQRNFLIILFPFFLVTVMISSLFSMENNFFIVFLPIILIIVCYWAQCLLQSEEAILSAAKFLTISFLFIAVFLQWTLHFNTYNKYNDEKFNIKKEAWIWVKENTWSWIVKNPKIMELSPIVSYYWWAKERWPIPYTDNDEDIIEYAKYNKIDYLVVDLLDFKSRPELEYMGKDGYSNKSLEVIYKIREPWKRLTLYKFKY